MFKFSLLLVVCLLSSSNLFAQETSHTLFAVDLSLSANDRDTAFEIIRATISTAPETQQIGLTLFDDTVRGHVPPSRLESQHVLTLNQALAEAPFSLRSTSNLAVGIERAIDALVPEGRTKLVVFSRGVIDTQSDDPRARFNEWLEKILLPQAQENNIATTLVVPQNESADVRIKQALDRMALHQFVTFESGGRIAPELVVLLSIPSGTYGTAGVIAEPVVRLPVQTRPNDAIAPTDPSDSGTLHVLPIVQIILLILALAILLGILFWRYRTWRALKNSDASAATSSTYLPLSEKPSKTMDRWVEKGTSSPPARSLKSSNSVPDATTRAARPVDASTVLNPDVHTPADKPVDTSTQLKQDATTRIVKPTDNTTIIKPDENPDPWDTP